MAEAHNANRKEHDKKYREANRPKITAKMREYRKANHGKDYEHTRKWEEKYPELSYQRKIKNYLRTRAANGVEMRKINPNAKVCKAYAGQDVQILPDKSPPRQLWILTNDNVRMLAPVSEIVIEFHGLGKAFAKNKKQKPSEE